MNLTDQELKKFYSRVSFSGLLILYALKLSLQTPMAFDRNDLSKAIDSIDDDYFLGFLVACTSLGITDYNSKGNVITVTYLDPLLKDSIEFELNRKSNENEYWLKWHKEVKEFFE